MELEIEPEPTPEERAAIEKALAEAGMSTGQRDPGAWWRAGIDEALGDGNPAAAPAEWQLAHGSREE